MINRRDFFKLSGLLILGTSLKDVSGDIPGERIIFTGELGNKLFGFDRKFFTFFMDLNRLKIEKINSPINSHSFVQNPVKKNQVVGIEKWGYGMALFDSNTLRLKKHIKLDHPKQFVGHGDFVSDGSLFYVSVSNYNDPYLTTVGKGFIHVYETKNYSLVDQFETFGFEPHQISFFNDDKYLLVLNPGFGKYFEPPFLKGKGPIVDFYPSITVIERKTKTLIKEILYEDKDVTMAHLTKMGEDEFFFVGGKKLVDDTWENKAFNFTLDGGLKSCETSGMGMKGLPLLSASYAPNIKTLAATSPRSDALLLWKDGILKTLDVKQPNGVSLTRDGKKFVISQLNGISFVDISEKKIVKQIKIPFYESSGGHSLII